MPSEKRVLHDALALPPKERAGIAFELIASLDGAPDEGVEEAWLAEAERRQRDAAGNPSAFESWDDVRARILKRLRGSPPGAMDERSPRLLIPQSWRSRGVVAERGQGGDTRRADVTDRFRGFSREPMSPRNAVFSSVDRTTRMVMSMVVAGTLACGPAVGDDEDSAADANGDGSSSSSAGTGVMPDDGASSAAESAPTSSTSEGGDDSSSSAMASSDDGSTGSPCDAGCDSLDEATCHACPDCTALDGTPWEEDPQGQWCLGGSVYLGCQSGACFSQTNTWCDGTLRYELDYYCIPEWGGLDPCEPPIDEFPNC